MTDADGTASIRFERDGTTGNTVHAAIAAPSGDYHAAGGMQAVTWDSQHRMTDAANAGDIVNLKADFSFGGATVTTDMGGGKALGGWKIEVTSGDEAVDGAPTALDADGSESFSETVTSVPKTYKIAMADNQANDSTGDGGETYASTELSHPRRPFAAGTSTDAGMLEVTYITQTLKVYIHQENDQVMGFTGNVLGGDVRMSGRLDVDIRHLDGGRSRAFVATDSVRKSESGGVVTFSNVPAVRNVIVTADEKSSLGKDADGDDIFNNSKLLKENGHSDELAAYTDAETNGIMGGAFGAEGGFNHTVRLCPLMSGEGDQRHGECSTFAFVNTYAVDGQAWKWVVSKSGDDFRYDADDNVVQSKAGVAGLTVSMDPVDGENLAGDQDTFTDEKGATLKFDFGHMAGGVYKVTAPSGWIARRGPLESPTNDLAERLTPLDSALNIDVTPTTGYVYGTVEDGENRRLAGVTVNVNRKTATTDSNGRYVVEGFGRGSCTGYRGSNLTCVRTAEEGSAPTTAAYGFAANSPRRVDITITDAAEVTLISGTVTHSSGGAGVGGVRVWVDGRAPLNPNARSSSRLRTNNIYVTGSDGSYTVRIAAKAGGASAKVEVSQNGRFFSPELHTVSAVAGADISGINFTAFDNGTIHGRVVDGSDNPISGVIVTASQVGGSASDADTTATTGTYSLSVRYGSYNVTAARAGHTFTTVTGVNVPNDGKAIDDIVGTAAEDNADLSALTLSGIAFPTRANPFSSTKTSYAATVSNALDMTTVRATPAVGGNDVDIYPDDADANTTGHQVALAVGTTDIEIEVTAADGTTTKMYTFTVTRRTPSTEISGTITDAVSGDGISGVVITVNGSAPLNTNAGPATARRLQTGSDGTYEAHVASTSGPGVVRATKAGYSFDPGSSTVTLNAGSVAGIDFVGSEHATITGRVVDSDGDALEGVTVTGTNGSFSDSDDTDRRGNYSLSVPAGTVEISAGAGHAFPTLSVYVTAGESRPIADITATRVASSDASLSELKVNDVEIEADADGNYAVDVGNDVTMASIVATATDADGATVAYSGTDADMITVGRQFALEVGGNETTVTVTAANGTRKLYTVTVTRAASSDASLSELKVNDMEIEADADGNYAANVAIDITMATIVATATSEEATVAYGGEDADLNTDGHQVALDVGDNEITVTVAAGDETQAEYTVTVTRAVPSSDASLSELTVNGTAVDADADGNYAAEVANDVTMATIIAKATDEALGAVVTYPDGDADPAMEGYQWEDLDVGNSNVITVTVTAADAITEKEYTVTVTRAEPSADASLSELTVNGDAVDADTDGDYAAVVANDVTMATIVATATDADGATVAYSGTDEDMTTDGHQVALEVGDNETTVTVTAADGTTEAVYTVTVTRGTVLSELTVNGTAIDASADGSYALR